MDKNTKGRLIYWSRKDAGLCTLCGKHPARPGTGTCMECALKKSERSASDYRKKKLKGVCARCGKPNDSDFIICFGCRMAQSKKYWAKKEERAKNDG